jgi:predicted small metal-binding protein
LGLSRESQITHKERADYMAKVISCRDVGMDCDFKASGGSVEEVMQAAAQHAKRLMAWTRFHRNWLE